MEVMDVKKRCVLRIDHTMHEDELELNSVAFATLFCWPLDGPGAVSLQLFFRFSRYLELGFLLSSLLASVGRGHLRVSVVGVLKSKLAARSLDEPARCFGVNIVDPTFQSTFHDLV
ncbi:hypothetical protein J6590_052735 [Homalodisca vitripennis]|nr:hypothetical protein J6590_052735 [Homalodisca vitripennis]